MTKPILTTFSCFLLIIARAHKLLAGRPGPIVPDGVYTNAFNWAQGTPGGDLFQRLMVGDFDAESVMRSCAGLVLDTLYPLSGPPYNSVILYVYPRLKNDFATLEFYPFRKKAEIILSGQHLLNITGGDYAVAREITGRLYHLMALVMLNDGKGTIPIGYKTGVGDYVRWKAGYPGANWQKYGSGDKWDQGYEVTGYFLRYLEYVRYGALVELNRRLKDNPYSDAIFPAIFFGNGVSQLWLSYKQRSSRGL